MSRVTLPPWAFQPEADTPGLFIQCETTEQREAVMRALGWTPDGSAQEPPATIEAAALCLGGTVYTFPRPARHHDIIRQMAQAGIAAADIALAEQGFITSDGRFVPRRIARRIAEAAGQMIGTAETDDLLFSENVW